VRHQGRIARSERDRSGGSGDEIAQACAEAAAHFDWAAWARQIDLDDVQVNVDGAQASVSLTGGAAFSLDRQRSGEWKIDGVNPPAPARSAPQGGGGLPSGGSVPTPQAPQRPQPPELPQLPQR
jgi:hypothetical protein